MAELKYNSWDITKSSTRKKSQIEEATNDSNDCEAGKEYKKRGQKLNSENESGKMKTENQTTQMVLLKSPNHIKQMPSGYLKKFGPYDIFWKALESGHLKTLAQKTDHLHEFLAHAERYCQEERHSSSKQLAWLEYSILFFVQARAIDAHLRRYSLTKVFRHVLVYLQYYHFNLPNKNYIESLIFNWLMRAYISKSKLGKAFWFREICRTVVEFSAPSRWTSLALEGEAMMYLAQADIWPKTRALMYKHAYDRYTLAFDHSSEQNPRIVHPRDHYLVKMLFIKLKMTKLFQNTLAPQQFHQFESSEVSSEDVRTAESLLKTLKKTWTEDPKHDNSFHLLVCRLSIVLRTTQLLILDEQFSDARVKLSYVYCGIEELFRKCDDYGVPTVIVKQLSDIADGLAHKIPSRSCDFEEERKMVFVGWTYYFCFYWCQAVSAHFIEKC